MYQCSRGNALHAAQLQIKNLYCDLNTACFMMTVKSEMPPNAFEILLSYQF